MRRLIPFLILLVLMVPTAAYSKPDNAIAKGYFKVGEELYSRADYPGALKQFKLAYKHSLKPALLYNIARCYESMGQTEEAIIYYESYLQHKPRNEELIRARIENLRISIEKRNEETAQAAPMSLPTAPDDYLRDSQKYKRKGPPVMKIVGWSLLVTGGALAITGATCGIMAHLRGNEVNDANQQGQEYADYVDKISSGKDLEMWEIISFSTAGAMLVSGGVLLYLDHRRAKAESALDENVSLQNKFWLQPAFSPHGWALVGGLRF